MDKAANLSLIFVFEFTCNPINNYRSTPQLCKVQKENMIFHISLLLGGDDGKDASETTTLEDRGDVEGSRAPRDR
jgi:hypothetical protein